MQSSITAGQIKVYSEKGLFYTKGVIFQFADYIAEALNRIDVPAYKQVFETHDQIFGSIQMRMGFRSGLADAIDSSKNAVKPEDSESDNDPKFELLNRASATVGAFNDWLQFVSAPIRGGIWVEAEISK